jgi:hypothetical protein
MWAATGAVADETPPFDNIPTKGMDGLARGVGNDHLEETSATCGKGAGPPEQVFAYF